MKALINHAGIEVKGCKAVILGSGGTSKTAKAVLCDLGAKEVFRVSRSGKDGAITYAEMGEKHLDAQIVVNTTPLGMYPNIFDMPLALLNLKNPQGVIDAVYNPLRTMTVMEGRSYGARAEGGLYMLVAQAVYASEIFFNTKYPEEKLNSIFNGIIRSKENIVLIGMPASGKTTVANLLADALERNAFDTDKMIVDACGKGIPEIFAYDGEAAFRGYESEQINKVSVENNAVIATGGGAILRSENVKALKQNGILFFLDRPYEKLIPTSDRPLASDTEAIKKRYEERYKIYVSSADVVIDADDTPTNIVKKIIGEFYK
jgi:shikimate dehydrogenase